MGLEGCLDFRLEKITWVPKFLNQTILGALYSWIQQYLRVLRFVKESSVKKAEDTSFKKMWS